jgi:hypothetical protein
MQPSERTFMVRGHVRGFGPFDLDVRACGTDAALREAKRLLRERLRYDRKLFDVQIHEVAELK